VNEVEKVVKVVKEDCGVVDCSRSSLREKKAPWGKGALFIDVWEKLPGRITRVTTPQPRITAMTIIYLSLPDYLAQAC
jgi:hypothetical protein